MKEDFFSTAAKLLGATSENLSSIKNDLKELIKYQIATAIKKMDFVSRSEFEVVKEMASRARQENEELKKEIKALKKENSK